MTVQTRVTTLLLTAGLLLAGRSASAAGGLSVSPISLEFDRLGAARALDVANPGNAPTQVQIRLFAWSADGGEDRTAPSADIGFSPPMFRLLPGTHQVVRLAATAPPGGEERAYRLYVEQLPEPGAVGLQMPVRMILPLFIEPNGSVSSRPRLNGLKAIRWTATYDPVRRRVRLTAANAGERRLRLLNLAYETNGAGKIVAPGLSGYVLAGKSHVWDFDYAGPVGGELTLRAQTDQGDLVVQTSLSSG